MSIFSSLLVHKMATSLTENYNELCRICAAKTSVLVGFNIFEGEGCIREINKKISTCLPIQINEDDQLPKMICGECLYNLDMFFNFREKSLRTESLLVELIKKISESTNKSDIEEPKLATNQSTINIVTTIQSQQLDLQNQDFDQTTNMRLVHELSKGETMNVEEDIILNSQNININHPLEQIQISSHELPTDVMTNVMHDQGLNLQHGAVMGNLVDEEINMQHSHMTVQNLELIHAQHNLMDQYGQEQIDIKNCVKQKMPVITLKSENELIDIKDEEIKNDMNNKDTSFKDDSSELSDSDASSDLDFDPSLESAAGEVLKNDDGNENQYFFENNLYEQTRDQFFNTNDIGTSVSSDGSQWYYCNVCGKAMSDKDDFLLHYEEHLNKCLACQQDFPDIETLHIHRKQTHPKKTVTGEEKSPKVPKIRTRLKPALKSDNPNDPIKKEDSDNEQAENGTPDEDEADEEDTDKNPKRKRCEPKVCKECGKSYKTNYKLQEHMRKHTGEQPYKCGTCDKAFRSKIGLAQHEAKHTGQYDYSCPTCGKGFQCRSYLIVHQRVHSDVKPYPCTTCGSNFKTKQSLLDHMNRHLGVKPYLCEICGRGFITKGLWKSHQKVHSGMDNRQYPCTVCNKMFVSKSYLATHVRIHTGEKPFMCEVCGKGFLTRVDLRIHSTMHTGEKSFVCEMCGKAFARRDALRCHRRSHTGERPYRCDVCGQTFTQFSPMAIHKRLHTGERPYSCEVCSKTFVSRSTMLSHRKKHVP